MAARRSSAVSPNEFAHPYLSPPPTLPKKREFGICNLFLFKMCGCFSADELPPPDFETPIYQAGKSSSSNFTFQTNTTTTPTTSRTHSPAKDTPHSPTLSTSPSISRVHFVGSTGVEDIPYRRPPPKSERRGSVGSAPSSARSQKSGKYQKPRSGLVESWESRAPVELAESDEVHPRKMVGNVSRLSAMFDQG